MNIIGPASIRLVDALAGWGLREAAVKHRLAIPGDETERTAFGVDVVLRHVPVLIARILAAEPLDVGVPHSVLRVDLGSEDAATLFLHNGMPLTTYTDRLSECAAGRREIEMLVQTPDPRPLVCTLQVADSDPDCASGPVVIFDGWHRAAAWLTRVRVGDTCRLAADLIKTKHSPV
jgi:hypothetical protein